MTTVAITGSSGYLGTRLVQALCSSPGIDRVLGFDAVEPRYTHERFVPDRFDIRDPALAARLKGVDVVVHLAFVMDPIKDESRMRSINVDGSHNVLRAAGAAGVRKIVYTSSAVVYGAHPDNPIPLTESAPLRANLDLSYAAHKLEVEYVIKEFRDEFPDRVVTVFRPAIVLGPHVDNAWSHVLELPLLLGVKGYSPPLQFVHEDDVAAALEWAVFNDADGPFNLSAEGCLELEHILDLVSRKRVELPEPAAFLVAARMWAMGLSEAPAGMLHYLMHPWVVSSDELAARGFSAQRSNLDALTAALANSGSHIRIGGRRVHRSSLWAAGGLGVAGVAAVAWGRRRRAA
ncbi:MAG TPA: NAD-dependent epimerase/dehydratase family protein [Actinomycetota bacterium]|nr:NAD-dependent epimerase/dehydratase family protein [Actinomycetota bacterium]